MNYVVYEFFTSDEIERDWLISILSDYNFEGFEETTDSLKAFISVNKADESGLKNILEVNELNHIRVISELLEDKNWNEEWEKNFQPVVIVDRVGIRAPFHKQLNTEFEIVIEPKMSFGTGHHSTTALMIELMLMENFVNKTVLDFGCGTGLLAIIACKLKAANTLAIDNDDWAYNNSIENIGLNHCVSVGVLKGDNSALHGRNFDIILANINRQVIMEYLGTWHQVLNEGGVLIISGILIADEADIVKKANDIGYSVKHKSANKGWMALAFKRS